MTTLSLQDPWFDFVKDGTKKYEGRLYSKNKRDLKKGDIITFSHYTDPEQAPFTKIIKKILLFDTFEDALKMLPINQVLPGVETIEEGIEVYRKFARIETQKILNVMMIELE